MDMEESKMPDQPQARLNNFDFDADFTPLDCGSLEEKEWNSDQIGFDFLKDEKLENLDDLTTVDSKDPDYQFKVQKR